MWSCNQFLFNLFFAIRVEYSLFKAGVARPESAPAPGPAQPPTYLSNTMNLTPAERSAFRAEAHALNPVVIIGEAGLTPSVLKEIDASLNAHGLIKYPRVRRRP